MAILKIIFAFFWFIFHVPIWLFAVIITVIRFPSVGEFSTEKFAEVFSQSVLLIENSDPMLLLIAILLMIIIFDVENFLNYFYGKSQKSSSKD